MENKSKVKRILGRLSPIIILVAVMTLLHLSIFGGKPILTWTRDLGAIEVGLINSLVVLALFLSYTMLNVCDLSTDGCYTLGVAVGGVVAAAGHPYLAILAALGAGALSGLVTAFLQTKMGINSLLAGIIVNTGLYSVNIVIMGKSTINVFKSATIFKKLTDVLGGSAAAEYASLIVGGIAVIVVITFLSFFLRTRLGLAIHATGDNPDMVKSSSISPVMTTIVGLMISGSMTALSGCLFIQYTKSADINVGTGKEVTIKQLAELVAKAVGFTGTIAFDATKPDGTPRKLCDVEKLHSLGWTHKMEIENGVKALFKWYTEN